jgi:hypothetical protein
MDQLIAQFWHRGTLYLGVAVVIVTFFARRIVELAAPSLKKQADENDEKPTYKTKMAEWWNGVILYAIPVVAGILGAVFWRSYFCADVESLKDAGMFGAIVGWFSSFLYKVIRKTLKKKTGIDPIPGPIDPTESDPPPKSDDDDEEDEPEDEKSEDKDDEDEKSDKED